MHVAIADSTETGASARHGRRTAAATWHGV